MMLPQRLTARLTAVFDGRRQGRAMLSNVEGVELSACVPADDSSTLSK
jgi:hypothetical protein